MRKPGSGLCRSCRERKHFYDAAAAPFLYREEIRRSLLRFKYSGKAEFAAFYAAAIWISKRSVIREWQPDVIVPVPVHPKRKQKRGYNQAALIARRLSALSGIPCDETLVRRVRETRPMSGLDHFERLRNVSGAFAVDPDRFIPLRILLVDDILTTGSTADALAALLKDVGAWKVYICCVCTDAAPAADKPSLTPLS